MKSGGKSGGFRQEHDVSQGKQSPGLEVDGQEWGLDITPRTEPNG